MGVGTDSRVTFKRRHCYATRSNKIRKFRTPGGKISIQYTTKKAKGPACAVSKETLQGIPRLRPVHYKGIKKNKRTVTRAYGGCISASSLRDRIMRAFVVEEQKVRISGRREGRERTTLTDTSSFILYILTLNKPLLSPPLTTHRLLRRLWLHP